MILTLPISQIINKENYSLIPGIKALEYKDPRPILDKKMESLFHSGYGIIQEEFLSYFDSIVDYLVENKVKMFSFDLGPSTERVEVEDYYYISKSKILKKNDLFEVIRHRIRYIKNRYKGKIAMENLNYFPTSAYTHVCETDFISDIVKENDVYLLLDIAHAVISAHNMSVDIYEYISLLPLSRVKEIHLSAPGITDGKWRDLHGIPTYEEYEVLDYISKQLIEEPYLVVECYNNLAVLLEIYENINVNYNLNEI